jgi:hypothetical protein
MLSRLLRNRRHSIAGVIAAMLLTTTSLTAAAQPSTNEPDTDRDCWLGSPAHYDDCVQANNWGAGTTAGDQSAFPDPTDASLVIDGIPSY